MNTALALSLAAALALACAVGRARRAAREGFGPLDNARETFYTRYARETPTRPYLAYTGTPPRGPWGPEAWAERYPGPQAPIDLGAI